MIHGIGPFRSPFHCFCVRPYFVLTSPTLSSTLLFTRQVVGHTRPRGVRFSIVQIRTMLRILWWFQRFREVFHGRVFETVSVAVKFT